MTTRGRLGIGAALLLLPLLLPALFVSWSGWKAREAFAHGALDRPVNYCFRPNDVRDHSGPQRDRRILTALVWQLNVHQDNFDPLTRHIREMGWLMALKIFWSNDERRQMDSGLRAKQVPCGAAHSAIPGDSL